MWHVYIIETLGGRLYTGIAKDPEKRFAQHQSGKGAKFFQIDAPRKIVWTQTCENRSKALQTEARIKKMRTPKKRQLIESQVRRSEVDDYKDIVQILKDRKKMLLARVNKIESNFRSVHSADSEERANESENDEVYEALDQSGREELMMIEEAFTRIDNKTFGICAECENKIQRKRIEASPFATMCIECATQAER